MVFGNTIYNDVFYIKVSLRKDRLKGGKKCVAAVVSDGNERDCHSSICGNNCPKFLFNHLVYNALSDLFAIKEKSRSGKTSFKCSFTLNIAIFHLGI